MTTQVLFIQGGGENVHDKWDNRIVDSLERELGRDYAVRYPRMPHEAEPAYAAWKAALKRQFDRLDDGAILIGHSIGGTILIRTLADEPPRRTCAGRGHRTTLRSWCQAVSTDADLSLSRQQGRHGSGRAR